MSDLRYPIGLYQANAAPTREEQAECIKQIREMPDRLLLAVKELSDSQMDTPYRPGGWTVRQVVHHLADSHLNWYARTKLALTEMEPVVKPFDENLWAELQDARTGAIQTSISLLDGLHNRWAQMFESLNPADWSRKMMHPERGLMALHTVLPMMAWHGRHHTAHIEELRKRMGW
jgi:uncharacterized damage-inducible protein DinB